MTAPHLAGDGASLASVSALHLTRCGVQELRTQLRSSPRFDICEKEAHTWTACHRRAVTHLCSTIIVKRTASDCFGCSHFTDANRRCLYVQYDAARLSSQPGCPPTQLSSRPPKPAPLEPPFRGSGPPHSGVIRYKMELPFEICHASEHEFPPFMPF